MLYSGSTLWVSYFLLLLMGRSPDVLKTCPVVGQDKCTVFHMFSGLPRDAQLLKHSMYFW